MSVRQVGGSSDDPFSGEERERPKSRADKRPLHVDAKEGEESLTPFDPELDEATRIYHRGAERYRNALRELAK
jgi:hypothetical protein